MVRPPGEQPPSGARPETVGSLLPSRGADAGDSPSVRPPAPVTCRSAVLPPVSRPRNVPWLLFSAALSIATQRTGGCRRRSDPRGPAPQRRGRLDRNDRSPVQQRRRDEPAGATDRARWLGDDRRHQPPRSLCLQRPGLAGRVPLGRTTRDQRQRRRRQVADRQARRPDDREELPGHGRLRQVQARQHRLHPRTRAPQTATSKRLSSIPDRR